jgi:hypothetical protein
VPIDPVQWARFRRVGNRGSLHSLATPHALQTLAFHEPLDCAASHMMTFTVQLSPDYVSATDLHIALPNPFDFRIQHVITLGASITQGRIPPSCGITSISRRSFSDAGASSKPGALSVAAEKRWRVPVHPSWACVMIK